MLGQSPVSPRPEIGDTADQGVPPGGDLRPWGPLVSGRIEERRAALGVRVGWATAYCSHWVEKKKGVEGRIWTFGPISREREEE